MPRSPNRTSVDGASVLDVGCGGGLLSRALAKRGAHVTGIDASSSAIAAAAAASSNDDVELIVGEAEHLEGREFDVVCALEVIEHVADAALFVRTLGRLAKRDVFLSTLDRTWLSWAVGVVAAEKIFGILPRGTHDWTKFLPPDEVAVMLGRAGLAVKDVAALHFVWGPLGLHRAWLGPFVPGLTPNYILHATKSNR
ncbi:hypothetical protein CTAYLR_007546 [Chrysophaeum taylorii]|uniref:Methyltransferase type 11 domain-containing protein n=1 Tax=Chrysophaeum taylorii TaxID=2483200 RepID=A0AAD7XGE9_9STRA|nr:hypothetical protein CTAYLR_007546 [Chrysophaeum taylorii]